MSLPSSLNPSALTESADRRTVGGPPVIAPFTSYLKAMRPEDVLVRTPVGVCCKAGGFHIDPRRPVDKAVITHGHSDHARAGHGAVLATQETLDLMRLRYGGNFAASTQAIRYGETVTLGGARVTFHPAGHVLGSAQIAVEVDGLRVVASGDYKNVVDPTCVPFELVRCDVFITEATFGLPVFRHGNADAEIAKLLHSVALFPERAHLVGAYSLGKAQRLIALIRAAGYDEPIYLHGAMEKITRYYVSRGIDLGRFDLARSAKKPELAGAITLCPPSTLKDLWSRRFRDPVTCFASGWMRVRARATAPGRIAAGDFGSRRLGWPYRNHRRDLRVGGLGHPRPVKRRWCIGASPAACKRGRWISSATAMRTKPMT
jgi:putative mRNA 3-end processing factor